MPTSPRQRLPGRANLRLLRLRAAVQDLSPEARRRLACLLYYLESGSLTDACAHFDIPRQRFYRLLRRFDPADLSTLEDRSGRLSAPAGAAPARPLVRRPKIQVFLLVTTAVSVATLAWLLAHVPEG